MNTEPSHTLTVNFDGNSWKAIDAQNNIVTLTSEDQHDLPALPAESIVTRLLLPVENLLCRTFSLPLSNAKFVDQDILAQELEEHTAERSDEWWLSWQADSHGEDRVSGLMFGLPEQLRQQFDAQDGWQYIQFLGTDIWARLNAQLDSFPEVKHTETIAAVLDADADGVFFGVWNPVADATEHGSWSGMRRLNWNTPEKGDCLTEGQCVLLAENIKRSLHSMGWEDDRDIVMGCLPVVLQEALAFGSWQGTLLEPEALPARHDANLALKSLSSLNFRHGRWGSSSRMGSLKPWYRSMALIAMLALTWSAGMLWHNHQLERQLESAQQRVIGAFHKGLPNEKVLIDALAQLRKAAGTSAGDKRANNMLFWLQRIAAINNTYQKTPWKIRELSFDRGKMSMSGHVKDLQTMNKIRKALQQATGAAVKIQDTELGSNIVKFRMVLS